MSRKHHYTTRNGDREAIYYVERLWKLTESFPIEELPIESLDIDKAVWFHGRCPPLTEVLEHFEKVLAADLDYPIILSATGKVMDGFHRLMKARLQGLRTVQVVRFEVDPEPDVVRAIESRSHRTSQEKPIDVSRADPKSSDPSDGYLPERLCRLAADVRAETSRLRAAVAAQLSEDDAANVAAAIEEACAAVLAELAPLPGTVSDESTGEEGRLAAALETVARVRQSLTTDERFAFLERARTELQIEPQHRMLFVAALDDLQAAIETLAICRRPPASIEP